MNLPLGGGVAADDLLSSLSHELRNPLAPMLNAAHALQMLRSDAESKRIQAILERQLTHMAKLFDDLMDLCRLSYGSLQVASDVFGADDLARRAVALSPFANGNGHQLEHQPSSQPLWLRGDETRLARALAALLDHAATRTPTGALVHLACTAEGDAVVFRVRDRGPGVPEEGVPLLFDLFSKVAYSPSRRAAGSGLGLPLARRLVEYHGGCIEAEAASEGLEVRVTLPAVDDAPADVPSPAPEPAEVRPLAKLAHRRVLIVDDNVDAAESLGFVLSLAGHAVEIAHDGPSAIAAARLHHPDAVLLDIGMPGMDGYEVARQLRRIPQVEKALLIAVTGFDQEGDRQRSRAAGIDWHLVKPADPVQLQALLSSELYVV